MALPLVLASLALCLSLRGVNAQTQSQAIASCHSFSGDPEQWSWMNNSKTQDPCLVVSFLQTPCYDAATAKLPPLTNSGTFYTGPSGQNDCLCNTVAYALIEACQLCQYDVPGLVQTWSGWSSACTTALNGSYPLDIPSGTAIPAWAYQDVIFADRFNLTQAQLVAAEDLPDVTPTSSLPASTATSSATASTTTSSGQSSSAPASSSSAANAAGSGKSRNVGAIVGGVVGGVVGLLLLGSAVFFFLLRRRGNLRRQSQAEAPPERPISTVTATDFDGGHQPSLKPVSMISTPSMLYDPDDPRTFPTFQTPRAPSPTAGRAVSPTPSGPPGSVVGGYMQSFGAMQEYSTSSVLEGRNYAASTYTGIPEI